MKPLAVLAAALALGCTFRRAKPEVLIAPGTDLMKYKRMGVLPFQDTAGRGIDAAEAFSRALWRLGVSTVEVPHMAAAFDALKLEPTAELSMHDLLEVRRVTHADALVFGSVGTRRGSKARRLAIMALDADDGELIARASVWLEGQGADALESAAERLVDAIKRELDLKRAGIKPQPEEAEETWP